MECMGFQIIKNGSLAGWLQNNLLSLNSTLVCQNNITPWLVSRKQFKSCYISFLLVSHIQNRYHCIYTLSSSQQLGISRCLLRLAWIADHETLLTIHVNEPSKKHGSLTHHSASGREQVSPKLLFIQSLACWVSDVWVINNGKEMSEYSSTLEALPRYLKYVGTAISRFWYIHNSAVKMQ